MSGLVGNPQSLRDFAKRLRTMPTTLAQDVAKAAAPDITRRAQSAYDSGLTVYDAPRPAGVGGNALSLVRSGDTRARVRFVSIGTVMRCVLGTRYAKYLIGKYDILPNGRLPAAWSRALAKVAGEQIIKGVAS